MQNNHGKLWTPKTIDLKFARLFTHTHRTMHVAIFLCCSNPRAVLLEMTKRQERRKKCHTIVAIGNWLVIVSPFRICLALSWWKCFIIIQCPYMRWTCDTHLHPVSGDCNRGAFMWSFIKLHKISKFVGFVLSFFILPIYFHTSSTLLSRNQAWLLRHKFLFLPSFFLFRSFCQQKPLTVRIRW